MKIPWNIYKEDLQKINENKYNYSKVWIKDIKKMITPDKEKYQKDSLYYDL